MEKSNVIIFASYSHQVSQLKYLGFQSQLIYTLALVLELMQSKGGVYP